MNKQHNTRFSVEAEKNGALPVLDIKINRESGKFVTSVHRKGTLSGVCKYFTSFIPLEYKFGSWCTLFHRSFCLVPDFSKFNIFARYKISKYLRWNKSRNMGRKTPIFFWFTKTYWKALQRPVARAQQNAKTRRAATQTTLFQISLTFLAVIKKRSEHRLTKEIYFWKMVHWLKVGLFLVFSWNSWTPYAKILFWSFLFLTKNPNQIHYFENF